MRKCMVCNNEIDDDCVFCPNCGTRLEKDKNSEEAQYSGEDSDSETELPFGTQSPFGVQSSFETQSPFGAQSPFGSDNFSGTGSPYGEENPYGAEDFYGRDGFYNDKSISDVSGSFGKDAGSPFVQDSHEDAKSTDRRNSEDAPKDPYGQNDSYNQNSLYNQGNPYNHSNPYIQGNPYEQGNPYNQGDPYSQKNPYNQDTSYNQGMSCNQNPSHSPAEPCKPPIPKKRRGILIPTVICAGVAVIVCGVLLVTKGGLFADNNGNEQKIMEESSDGSADTSGLEVSSIENTDTADSDMNSGNDAEPVSELKAADDSVQVVEEPTEAEEPTSTPAPVSYVASDIIASLVNKDSVDMSRLKDASILSADSSSVISQKNTDNSAYCLFDDNIQTNWQEGVDGSGIGQSVTAYFDGTEKVRCMLFKLGNWKTEEYFYGNNRPSKLGITIGDFSTEVEFPESWEEFCVELNHSYEASSITFTINDVYKGTNWDDTVITDIRVLCDKE